jgi:hypothetical protein
MGQRQRPLAGRSITLGLLTGVALLAMGGAATASDPAERLAADVKAGKPLVAHVFVALCDNDNQGIVPVPRHLGNGASPSTNLYWGAQFGVRRYFSRVTPWARVKHEGPVPPGVLERAVFGATLPAFGQSARVYVIADAWDGRNIRDTIGAFLEAAAGRRTERITVDARSVAAGGAAHVVAFVGHDGLMDFDPPAVAAGAAEPARAAIVLACTSESYFGPLLRRARALSLLLTTSLMAPEAYTLEAALRAWFSGAQPDAVVRAAARAYDSYQHCGTAAARRLFVGERP